MYTHTQAHCLSERVGAGQDEWLCGYRGHRTLVLIGIVWLQDFHAKTDPGYNAAMPTHTLLNPRICILRAILFSISL